MLSSRRQGAVLSVDLNLRPLNPISYPNLLHAYQGAWWVRAAALALGGEADYDRSKDREGFHELWFTIPAENVPDDGVQTLPANGSNGGGGTKASAASGVAGAGAGGASPAGADAPVAAAAAAARAFFDGSGNDGDDGDVGKRRQEGTGQAPLLPQPLLSERSENLQAATAAAAAAGAGRAARRASRRKSTKATTLAPLASSSGDDVKSRCCMGVVCG